MTKRKKELDQVAKRKKIGADEVDVMNNPYTENGALGNLFGEE